MPEPILETRNLTKTFGALKACSDVSLSVQAGEIHAVIGPNGAGKSTLIQQISGALAADTGQVFLAGIDVTALPAARRARMGLARTFQISALAMEDTVLQNAALGVIGATARAYQFRRPALGTPEIRDAALDALERVGLASRAQTLCAALSHGERRQLEIAVALTLRPKVFVMDEPMAGLGADGSARMTTLLDTLRQEAPILLVEHDMDVVFRLADRITVLDYGQVIATGTVAEIRANPAVQVAYLGGAA